MISNTTMGSKSKIKPIGHLLGTGNNNDEAFVAPENGKKFSLKELQGFVGGLIEIVPTKEKDMVLVINEEGKLNGSPVNMKATKLYLHGVDRVEDWDLGKGDLIFGDVLLVANKYVN